MADFWEITTNMFINLFEQPKTTEKLPIFILLLWKQQNKQVINLSLY